MTSLHDLFEPTSPCDVEAGVAGVEERLGRKLPLGWLVRVRLTSSQLTSRSRAWLDREWPGLELEVST